MVVHLEGGCVVREMHEGVPSVLGTLSVWKQLGSETGARSISLRILEFAKGLSPGLRNEESDEVLYFSDQADSSNQDRGPATVYLDGRSYRVFPGTGLYLRPGKVMMVNNPATAPAVFISSLCPDSTSTIQDHEPVTELLHGTSEAPPLVSLAERDNFVIGDRWYRVLVDQQLGSSQVTQFVGSIPPGRAPDHSHNYEEVLFILRGKGRMWAASTNTPISPGSCIYLPKGQTHCVENTGTDELRLLGVFYPAGSPATHYEESPSG